MKTTATGWAFSLLACVSLASCGVTDPGPEAYPPVSNHFYPFTNGTVYVYSRSTVDNTQRTHTDTIGCTLLLGATDVDKNKLVITNGNPVSPGQPVLFYLGYTSDHSGQQAAVLATDSTSVLALDGSLKVDTSWMADPVRGIIATVVGHYYQYWLPGNNTTYEDVVAIKYQTIGEAENVYTLRYFAKDQGLILECQITPMSNVTSLQLLSVTAPPTTGSSGPPDFSHQHHHPQYYMAKAPGPDDDY